MIYTFNLDADAVNKIARGLLKLPYEEVAALIAAFQQSVTEQEAAAKDMQAKAGADAAVARAADGVVADAKAGAPTPAKERKPRK
jgi:hypothetical protein